MAERRRPAIMRSTRRAAFDSVLARAPFENFSLATWIGSPSSFDVAGFWAIWLLLIQKIARGCATHGAQRRRRAAALRASDCLGLRQPSEPNHAHVRLATAAIAHGERLPERVVEPDVRSHGRIVWSFGPR